MDHPLDNIFVHPHIEERLHHPGLGYWRPASNGQEQWVFGVSVGFTCLPFYFGNFMGNLLVKFLIRRRIIVNDLASPKNFRGDDEPWGNGETELIQLAKIHPLVSQINDV